MVVVDGAAHFSAPVASPLPAARCVPDVCSSFAKRLAQLLAPARVPVPPPVPITLQLYT